MREAAGESRDLRRFVRQIARIVSGVVRATDAIMLTDVPAGLYVLAGGAALKDLSALTRRIGDELYRLAFEQYGGGVRLRFGTAAFPLRRAM